MKHLALLFLIGIALYSAWVAMSPQARQEAKSFLSTHGLKAVFTVVVLFGALALAYQDVFPSIQLLK